MKKKLLIAGAVLLVALVNILVFVSSNSSSTIGDNTPESVNTDSNPSASSEPGKYPDVQIGDNHYASDTTELTFNDGEYDYSTLLANLAQLPELTELNLPKTTLSGDQLAELKTTYPQLQLNYSVMLLDQEISQDVTELDLSTVEPGSVDELAASLSRLPNITDIQLMDADGSSKLAPADVKKLVNAASNANIHYTFELFGKTISTTDERVEYVQVDVGNSGMEKVREALDILPKCTYFKLDRCGIDHDLMVKLRDDYPNVKIVWRVNFASYNCLTDVEMIHCTGGLTAENTQVLKYCTDVVYLDIGHNKDLTDISFVNYMPKLKIAIIVDSKVTTLEPFANCPDLERLEIVACTRVTDLSPLAKCTKLKGFNMSCATGVTDLSPLYGLQDLERLYLGTNYLPKGQYEAACEHLPNCWITNEAHSAKGVSRNYAIGWRLDEDGSRADWYVEVREIFRYDENYYNFND